MLQPVKDLGTPPLDLLRQATALRSQGLEPLLRFGTPEESWEKPAAVIITAVFSWDFPVLKTAIKEAQKLWPDVPITLSGVLVRRMGLQLAAQLGVRVADASIEAVLDALRPDYSLVPNWDASILITSKGVCPRECEHCDAFQKKKGLPRLIHSWDSHLDSSHQRVEVWDNTLMLTPREHYNQVTDTLLRFERPVDFVCGIAPGGIDIEELEWRIERLRGISLSQARLECNTTSDFDRFYRCFHTAEKTFGTEANFSVFAVINGTESPHQAWQRLEKLDSLGVKINPIVFTPHEWLCSDLFVNQATGWTAEDLKCFIERWPPIRTGQA